MDYMVKPQIDEKTNEVYPPFGVENTDEYPEYKKYETPETEDRAIWAMKADRALNTEMHSYAQAQMSSGKIKFLIDERQAKVQLLESKMGKVLSLEQRAEKLKPYTLTTILREEMLNLVEETEGLNIVLKQSSKSIKKDKFSAFEYGLYYIRLYEETRLKKKKRGSFADAVFFTTH